MNTTFLLDSRVSCRLVVLLKALLKLICDVARDSSLTPESVKSALLEEATNCLILLDRCASGRVKVRDRPLLGFGEAFTSSGNFCDRFVPDQVCNWTWKVLVSTSESFSLQQSLINTLFSL